jgi:hypothetical protein
MNLGKKVKIFGKQIPIAAIALLAIAGLASAGLLSYYGKITGTATVEQSVFLDGKNVKNGSLEITYSYTGVAGDTVVDGPHKLVNNANVPAKINFETTCCNSTGQCGYGTGAACYGITTTPEMLLANWSKNQTDFSKQDYLFKMYVVNNADGSLTWTVIDMDGNSASYPAGTITVFDKDGNAKFLVGYNTETTNSIHTIYKEWTGSAWVVKDVPSDFNLSRDNDKIVVTIPASRLSVDSRLAFNVERIGVASAVNARYPTNWAWQGVFPNAVSRFEKGDVLTSPVTLTPGELLWFNIRHEFAINLVPDQYTITTGIVPVTQP